MSQQKSHILISPCTINNQFSKINANSQILSAILLLSKACYHAKSAYKHKAIDHTRRSKPSIASSRLSSESRRDFSIGIEVLHHQKQQQLPLHYISGVALLDAKMHTLIDPMAATEHIYINH